LSNFNLTHLDKKALESIVKKYGNNKPIINLILVNYFHKFQNLDEESARILLDYGLGIFVIQGSNLGKFVNEQSAPLSDELAIKLIKQTGQSVKVLSGGDPYKFFRFADIDKVLNVCVETKKELVGIVDWVKGHIKKGNRYNINIPSFLRHLMDLEGTEWSIVSVFEYDPFFNSLTFEEKKDMVEKILEDQAGGILYSEVAKNKLLFLGQDFVDFVKKFYHRFDRELVYKFFKGQGTQEERQEMLDNFDEYRVKALFLENAEKEESLGEDLYALHDIRNNLGLSSSLLGKLVANCESHDFHVYLPSLDTLFDELNRHENSHSHFRAYSKAKFRGEFIEKLIKDNSLYSHTGGLNEEEDTMGAGEFFNLRSLAKFSKIVSSLDFANINQVLESGKQLEVTRDLAVKLEKEGPIHSWENLKKFYELSEMLRNKDVLEKLQDFKDRGMHKHYNFFRRLAFYPNSKIPMQKVFEFMNEPEKFLGVDDLHGNQDVNERKKPVNMLLFPHLDLDAFDLRDALVGGTLDELQFFPPAEAHYKVYQEFNNQELLDILRVSLRGEEREDGTIDNARMAHNPRLLFRTLQDALRQKTGRKDFQLKELFELPVLVNFFKKDIEDVLFRESKSGPNGYIVKFERKFVEYRVRVQKKSSVEGILTGDDLVNCMPFGSGKNNNYMYNLGCAMLTVEKKMANGQYRTVSGSVIAKAADTGLSIPKLIGLANMDKRLSEVIPKDLTRDEDGVLLKDNIEVSPNFKNLQSQEELEKVLQDFSFKYLDSIGDKLGIVTGRFLVGMSYNDLQLSSYRRIPNTYLPHIPYAYSDNYGAETYEVGRLKEMTTLKELVVVDTPEHTQRETEIKNKGVRYLEATDSLRVSYLEGKIYADNDKLLQHIHRLSNEITGLTIQNRLKRKPNPALKSVTEGGELSGYLIAYEGVMAKHLDPKVPVVYISDFAVDKTKDKGAGEKILREFMHLIEENYFKEGIQIPFKFRAREKTSYILAKKSIDILAKKYGLRYELKILTEQKEGDDKMIEVEMLPVTEKSLS
jgi:hypothetical protein